MAANRDEISVLHVDDEPDFADLAAKYIERHDERFTVKTARSAAEGLDRLTEHSFDCVVSDYDMPKQTGIDFLEAVREEYPELPFILYTGKGSEEVASEAISAGVTDYLQKETGSSQYEVLSNRILNVVDQQRARKEVAETEQRLRTISENTNEVLWKFTADWDELLFINSPYEDIWGGSIDELRTRPQSFLENVHPDDRAKTRDAMKRLSNGESIDYQHRVNPEEDYSRWVWVQGEPVFDEDGEVEEVVGFARDITELIESERALSQTSQRLNLALDATDTGIFEWPVGADTLYWSPELERLVGLDPGEFEGTYEAFTDRVHDDDLPAIEERIQTAVEDGEQYRIEFRMRHEAGHYIQTEAIGQLIETHDVPKLVGITRDVTGRSGKDESRIDYRMTNLKGVLEASPNAVLLVDDTGVIRQGNRNVEDVLGYTPEEISGMGVEDLLREEDRDHHVQYREEYMESPEPRPMGRELDLYALAKSGEEVPVEISLGPVREDGDPYVMATIADVSRRKERERELQRKNERLDEFASVVSHDLRNPLGVARGRLELASEECASEHHASIERAHDRMESLIEELLALARAGVRIRETDAVELATVADTCWSNVETRNADLSVDTETTIEADESRVKQLLGNLMRNAVQHAGPDVTVSIGDLPGGFYVEDDGPGIPEDDRENVLQPGYTNSDKGTGYGLSIVRDIAEAHGWTVKVTSGSTGGARFEFSGVQIT